MTNQDEETEVVETLAMFNCIVDKLRFHRRGFSKEERDHIHNAPNYFVRVGRGLEEIYRVGHSEQEHLTEIFEAINSGGNSIQSIVDAIEQVENVQEYLYEFQDAIRQGCPREFYETKRANELLDVCQKFRRVYEQLS